MKNAGKKGGRSEEGLFTQYPRWFRHLAPALGFAELKVVIAIIEGTRGWHRTWVPFSLRGLAQAAGLDKSNAIKALRVLMDAGVVAQRDHGRARSYGLKQIHNEYGWVQIATKVAQGHQRWRRNAPRSGRKLHPHPAENPPPERADAEPKEKLKETSKENTCRPSGRRVSDDVGDLLEGFTQQHEKVLGVTYMRFPARDRKLLQAPLRAYGHELVKEMMQAFWDAIRSAQRKEQGAYTGKTRPDIRGFLNAIPNLIRDYEFDHAATQE